jgi:predicted Fe-Mo cluster-binding NifX family protein
MKLAVTHENGQVFQHFGKTKEFKIYDIQDGKIGFSMVISAGGQGHGALAGFLRMLGISVVLCGGIGPGAQDALAQLDITPIPGVQGDADQAVQDFLDGKLTANTEALCNHHHDPMAFGCGGQGCGQHGEGGCCH